MSIKNVKVFWLAIISLSLVLAGVLFFAFSYTNKSEIILQPSESNRKNTDIEASGQDSAIGIEDVSPKGELFKVVRVIDGDTIELEGGQTVRYIGIDTPETVHPQKAVQCFGREASNKNKELVEGKEVQLEKDISETDKYGRLLRYVYVGDVFINELLVREGFAHASSYPPDIKYQNLFGEAQREAQGQNRGLWVGCGQNSSALQTNPDGCQIKGNLSFSTGEKIYHMPGQEYYDKTVIDQSKGERWFCTEEEAQKAGWRKSKK